MKELLTGKCKEDFEKWYEKTYEDAYEYSREVEETKGWIELNGFPDETVWSNGFYDLSFTFQYGVYLEFFDSVGIYISIEPLYDMQGTNRLCIYSLMLESNYYLQCKNRKAAQEQAIIKANSIYNER